MAVVVHRCFAWLEGKIVSRWRGLNQQSSVRCDAVVVKVFRCLYHGSLRLNHGARCLVKLIDLHRVRGILQREWFVYEPAVCGARGSPRDNRH